MRRFLPLKYPLSGKWLGLALVATGFLLFAFLVFRSPFSETLNAADHAAIRHVIQAQIDAFRLDDAERAFSLASPNIQARFGTPEQFMAMVKVSYQPVYRPRAVFFQDLLVIEGIATQRVLVVDAHNTAVMAIYLMQQQTDGSWRIAGCFLAPNQGLIV